MYYIIAIGVTYKLMDGFKHKTAIRLNQAIYKPLLLWIAAKPHDHKHGEDGQKPAGDVERQHPHDGGHDINQGRGRLIGIAEFQRVLEDEDERAAMPSSHMNMHRGQLRLLNLVIDGV
jgi:hypothetical protein